ncbi:sigma-70 family RNA polymerase sigma factor [Kitasatospora sp. NPDC087314]|uniref:BACON domain-containing protein n=1 Tax=Kitasatospora sp. NPDC087314 TaxID=3364068 RepID=UPI0038043CAA
MTTRTEGPPAAVLAAYDRQVDGLFTYCLSVLCEHDAAAGALREVRELARQHGARLAEPGLVRAWLFSLARYCCLRRLSDGAGRETTAEPTEAETARRRRELASLAWPEAAGTDPEQREALELSVRHRLTPHEVAAVLGLPFERTRALLGAAEAEVARTRAALLVLGVGSCPELDRLGGAGTESWRDWVLGPALRRELVQHVVDCPTCRGTAERVAGEAAEGSAGVSGLPLLAAPAPAAASSVASAAVPSVASSAAASDAGSVTYPPSAVGAVRRAGAVPAAEPGLRFDQSGFPRHRAPDAGRALAVRRRMVTTGVLAAVLAAPVVALWAGHRGDGSGATAAVSTVRVEEAGQPDGRRPAAGAPAGTGLSGAPGMPGMELAGAGAVSAEEAGAETLLPGFPRLAILGPVVPVPARGATPISSPTLVAAPAPTVGRASAPGAGPGVADPAPAGLLTVEAAEYGSRTVLTLTNSGTTEIRWRAATDAGWLRLSRDCGTLAPGQRITVIVTVDEDLAPTTHWTARIALPPSQAVVTLEGGPHNRGGSASSPADPGTSGASPTATASGPATATAGPTPSGTPHPSGTGTATPSGSPSSSSAGPSSSASPSPSSSASAHPSSPPPSGTATAVPTGTASPAAH